MTSPSLSLTIRGFLFVCIGAITLTYVSHILALSEIKLIVFQHCNGVHDQRGARPHIRYHHFDLYARLFYFILIRFANLSAKIDSSSVSFPHIRHTARKYYPNRLTFPRQSTNLTFQDLLYLWASPFVSIHKRVSSGSRIVRESILFGKRISTQRPKSLPIQSPH